MVERLARRKGSLERIFLREKIHELAQLSALTLVKLFTACFVLNCTTIPANRCYSW